MFKTLKFENREEWLEARRGKITGTRLGSIVVKRGTGKKIGYYELIAERLADPADEENPMERGQRLEGEAIDRFEKETKKKVNRDLVILSRDDNDNISISPDGTIGETEAVEVKCLASARHLEALLTDKVPSEHEFQTLQYFIVNDKLKKLNVIFYDPRIMVKDYFVLEIKREDVKADIEKYLEYQIITLAEVEKIVNDLSF